MFFSSKLSMLAAITGISLLVIPVVRSAEIDVTVGGVGIIQYTPSFVTANPGDVIRFTFQQKNHTATQSSFASPCTSLEGGFDSGFIPVAANVTSGFPVAELQVQDTNPIWVYCRQTGHCQQGMVFAVNPGDKFAAFQAAATAGASAVSNASASASASSTASSPTVQGTNVVTVTATITVTSASSTATATTTYVSYPGSASPSSLTSSDHRVVVGGSGKIFYSPANITAQPGDTVTFEFQQKNHTVTASSFATPCIALKNADGSVAWDSGFMPVADNITTNFPTFTIQINDTKPIWAYCRQTGHCGQGMVFSVNAVDSGSNTFEAFQAAAIAQNGTNATTTSSASGASGTSNSAASIKGAGAGLVLAVISAIVGSLL